MKQKVIVRTNYLKKIKPFIGKSIIKVIVGQRRVGKSYFLLNIQEEIRNTFPKHNIISINKELHDFISISNFEDLIEYVHSKYDGKCENFVFIDEIQEIESFEKALRSLLAEKKYDIYCTGSNAHLLSGELATLIGGRYIETTIYPLNYSEFLLFHKKEEGEESFNTYLKYGGLPYLINLPLNDEVVFEYLGNIYKSILLKDIIARHNIRNVSFLENLSYYVSDTIGNLVSSKKITDYLKSQRIKISNNVVMDYLSFLAGSYLLHKVKRADVNGKKVFEIGEKYYFNDVGLRNAIAGYKINDIGKLMENIIYNHLLTLGYKVFIGKLDQLEIDFVATKNNETIYIQVAYLLIEEKTIEREFGNLLKIKDNYPKYVVSYNPFTTNTYKGIKHLNIIEFLTMNTY